MVGSVCVLVADKTSPDHFRHVDPCVLVGSRVQDNEARCFFQILLTPGTGLGLHNRVAY